MTDTKNGMFAQAFYGFIFLVIVFYLGLITESYSQQNKRQDFFDLHCIEHYAGGIYCDTSFIPQ